MKKIITLLIIAVITTLPANADVVRISADDAVKLAIEHNLALQSKHKNADILKQEVKMANALKNPQVQSNILMGSISRTNSSQAGIAVPVEISKRGVRKKAAIARLKLLEDQIRQEELNLKIDVMSAYFDVVYMKTVVAILKQREELYNAMSIMASSKPKSSVNYEIEKLQSDMRHKKQVILLNKAKADLLCAQFHLNEVMNLKNSDIMYDARETSLFEDHINLLDLQIPEYKTIEDIAMKYSYSIRISDDNIAMSKAELNEAKHKIIPDLTFAGGYAFSGDGKTQGAYVGGALDLPIFYTYRPEVNRAKIVLERAKIDRISFENKLKFALKQDFNRFKYAKENINYYKDILKDSEIILKMSGERYEKGQTALLNVFINENAHREVLNEYINAMQIYYRAYLDLMHNVGHDLLLDESVFEDI